MSVNRCNGAVVALENNFCAVSDYVLIRYGSSCSGASHVANYHFLTSRF